MQPVTPQVVLLGQTDSFQQQDWEGLVVPVCWGGGGRGAMQMMSRNIKGICSRVLYVLEVGSSG